MRAWEGGVGEGHGKKNGLAVGEGDEGSSGEAQAEAQEGHERSFPAVVSMIVLMGDARRIFDESLMAYGR